MSTTRTRSAPTVCSTRWPRTKIIPGPLVVVDFGTATTFDVVDGNGAYLGGVISPGINLSIEALHRAAARLPRIGIGRPQTVDRPLHHPGHALRDLLGLCRIDRGAAGPGIEGECWRTVESHCHRRAPRSPICRGHDKIHRHLKENSDLTLDGLRLALAAQSVAAFAARPAAILSRLTEHFYCFWSFLSDGKIHRQIPGSGSGAMPRAGSFSFPSAAPGRSA